jgi:putative flippase GtrA
MTKWVNLTKQLTSYGAIGLGQVVIDWLIFVFLSQLGVFPGIANVRSRVCGAIAGFWFNGRWTFARSSKLLRLRHLIRYSISWAIMTVVSTAVVMLVEHGHGLGWVWVVKPIADMLLAVLGFVISKYWIYHHQDPVGTKDLKREAL